MDLNYQSRRMELALNATQRALELVRNGDSGEGSEAFELLADIQDYLDGTWTPGGPDRLPKDTCESGKREYCTCDTCF